MPDPSEDERQEFLLSARFGDLADIEALLSAYPAFPLDAIQDDNGNTLLHMAAGNGHTDVLSLLLPIVPPRLLTQRNDAGSTPLHWAAFNHHLDVAKLLVQSPAGPGIAMIDIKNNAGRSPLAEAELAGWDEGARWFVQVMHLDDVKEEEVADEPSVGPSRVVEVEIQDADGQIAGMSIDPKSLKDPS